MAYLPGGDSNKKGNYYENKVVVSKYIDMLSGKYSYVQHESHIKSEEIGVDILVENSNGEITCFQCKSRNGINDSWSISDLINGGILRKALGHTRRGVQFVLVSPLSPCYTLKDFCDRAKTFSNLQTFEKNAIGGKEQQKEYEKIKNELSKEKDITDEDILSFFNLFKFEIIHDDDQSLKRKLELKAQIINVELAYELLISYVESHNKTGHKIRAFEIINHLKSGNVNFFRLDIETESKKIMDLQNKFKNSLNRKRIKGRDYERIESLKTLESVKSNKFTILTGEAASGKSFVSKQTCELMDLENIMYLPIDISSYDLKNSFNHFNQELGFNQGIIRTLSKLSPKKTVVLVLDQLDSIGWNSQLSSGGKDLCYDFVKESLFYDNVHILFVAREVEVKNIKQMVQYEQNELKTNASIFEIKVNNLTNEEINKIAPELNLNLSVRKLLSIIGNIELFLSLKEEQEKNILNSYELIKAFIESKHSEIIVDYPKFNTLQFCTKLADKMTKKGTFSVSKLSLDISEEIINKLFKVGLINIFDNNRVGFIHQIIFDFIIARENYKKFETDGSIIDILKKYNNNFLEKYEIIKQFLEMLFRNNSEYIYDYIEAILFSNKLVFSIKRLTLDFLNINRDNSEKYYKLIDRLIESNKYGLKYITELSLGKTKTVEHLISNGIMDSLLSDDKTLWTGINILLSVQDSKRAANYLYKKIEQVKDANIYKQISYYIDDIKSNDLFFDIKIHLIKNGLVDDVHIDWDTLLQSNINRVFRYLEIIYDQNEKFKTRVEISKIKNEVKLKQLFEVYGKEIYVFLKKYLFSVKEIKYKFMMFNFNDVRYYDNENAAIDLFVNSIQYQEEKIIISYFYNEKYSNFFIDASLNSLIKMDDLKALKIFKKLIDEKFILTQNFYNYPGTLFYLEKVIKKLSPLLEEMHFNCLLKQIIIYKRTNFINHVKETFARRKQYNIWVSYWGEEQNRLLNCLPESRLDLASKELKAVLNRRFKVSERFSNEVRTGVRSYNIVSGINLNNKTFSKKTWVKILKSTKAGVKNNVPFEEKLDKSGNIISTDAYQFNRIISDGAYENKELFVDILLTEENLRLDYVYLILDSVSSRYGNKESKVESSPLKILEAHKLYYNQNNEKAVSALINFSNNYKIDDEWLMNILLSNSKQTYNNDTQEDGEFDSAWQGHFSSTQSGSILGLSKYIAFTKQTPYWFDDIFEICLNSSDLKVVLSGVDLVYSVCTINPEYGIEYFLRIFNKQPLVLELNTSLALLDYSIKKHNNQYIKIINSKLDKFSSKGMELLRERLISYYCFYGINKEIVLKIIKEKNQNLEKKDRFIYIISEIIEHNINKQDVVKRSLFLINRLIKSKNRTTGDLIFLAKKNLKFYNDRNIISKIIKKSKYDDEFNMKLFYLDDIFKNMPDITHYSNVIFSVSSVMIKKKSSYSYDAIKVVNWLKTLYWSSKQEKTKQRALRNIDKMQFIYGKLL